MVFIEAHRPCERFGRDHGESATARPDPGALVQDRQAAQSTGLCFPIPYRSGCPTRAGARLSQLFEYRLRRNTVRSVSSHDVMAVDPDSLAMSPPPMSRPPGVIRVARVITRPVSVIRPIANLHGHRTWVTSIIGSTISTIVGSVVARISSIISFTAYCAEHGET